MADVDLRKTLAHLEALERELAIVRRDVLRTLSGQPRARAQRSLYGRVPGGDVTDEMIDAARRSLFGATS